MRTLTASRLIRPLLLLSITLPFTARGGHAQSDTSRVGRIVREVCPGAQIRASVRGAENVEGRCGAVTDGRLMVLAPRTRSEIPVMLVDSLWVQRGHTTEATVVLAAAGAAIGFLATPDRVTRECTEQQDCGRDRVRIISATTGAFVGALAGRFVGPRLLSWVRLAP